MLCLLFKPLKHSYVNSVAKGLREFTCLVTDMEIALLACKMIH